MGPLSDTEFVATHLTSVATGDDLLRKFWEVEEKVIADCTLSLEERSALKHFNLHCTRDDKGRFVVPLPKRALTTKLGESRSQAQRRLWRLKNQLMSEGSFQRSRM